MIPRSISTWQTKSWQEELSSLITCPKTLLQRLQLPDSLLPQALAAAKLFPMRVTESYISRITPGDIHDPLLRQILPIQDELNTLQGFSSDPLQEHSFNATPGLVHKYHGRLLLIASPQCAINCRYCFRREFDYSGNTLSRQQWMEPLRYIAENNSIEEVILSGGDPLAIADGQLRWLLAQIENIPHVERLRIHSRLPIVLPSRINTEFMDIFAHTRLQLIMVNHCNHPQEIDAAVDAALTRLRAQFTVLNQAVLLAGVNDNAQTLIGLSQRLFKSGTLPYYLHLLDKIRGAGHFDVPELTAKHLHQHLLTQLPGYLVPKLVREEAGAASKSPIV